MPIRTKNDLLLEEEELVFKECYRPSVPFRWMRRCPWCTAAGRETILTVETLLQPWLCPTCGWTSHDKTYDRLVRPA